MGIQAGGTDNYVEGVGSANVNALHDGFKNVAHLLLAALEESGSVDVPVERGAPADLILLDADEVGFDVVAVRMVADPAVPRVAGEIRGDGIGDGHWGRRGIGGGRGLR